MRTKILGLVALTLVMVTTTFAKNIDDNVNARALTTFSQKFSDVKDVNWAKSDNYYKMPNSKRSGLLILIRFLSLPIVLIRLISKLKPFAKAADFDSRFNYDIYKVPLLNEVLSRIFSQEAKILKKNQPTVWYFDSCLLQKT